MHSLSRDTNLSPLIGERSLGESWSFYNYVGGGETGVVFPSTVRNPNKALCTINGRTSEVSVFLLLMCYVLVNIFSVLSGILDDFLFLA